jgi:hypothetical protein
MNKKENQGLEVKIIIKNPRVNPWARNNLF